VKLKLFGIAGLLVMAAAWGISAAGCDTGTNGGDGGGTTFTLSVAVADGSSGMGSAAITEGSPTGNAAGARAAVTAAPAANYHFVKWTNNTSGMGSVSTDNPYTFTINADTALCAVFAPDNDIGLTLSVAVADGSSGMGSAAITEGSPTGNAPGAPVTVTAAPAAGCAFMKWAADVVGMKQVSTSASFTFTMSEDTALYAVFFPNDDTTGIFNPAGTWKTPWDDAVPVTFAFTGGTGGTGTWSINIEYGSDEGVEAEAPQMGSDSLLLEILTYTDSGTFTSSGNYGTIYSNRYRANIGAYALTSSTSMTAYMVPPNPTTGTYYITKVSP
jgi:hypothetical protein